MSQKDRKVVIVGARSVGKSSLSTVFAENKYNDQYSPTIENCYSRKMKIKGVQFCCNIVDTAGQDQFSIFQPQYALGVEGYVMVYSFELIPTLNDKILNITGNDKIPRIIVANKVDLEQQRKVSQDEGINLAKKLNCQFIECSAKLNKNVTDSFIKLIENIEGDQLKENKEGCTLQ